MKTTKVVEIEICDSCGREVTYPQTCTGCGKEICNSCTGNFLIRVIESTKYKYTPTRADSLWRTGKL